MSDQLFEKQGKLTRQPLMIAMFNSRELMVVRPVVVQLGWEYTYNHTWFGISVQGASISLAPLTLF